MSNEPPHLYAHAAAGDAAQAARLAVNQMERLLYVLRGHGLIGTRDEQWIRNAPR